MPDQHVPAFLVDDRFAVLDVLRHVAGGRGRGVEVVFGADRQHGTFDTIELDRRGIQVDVGRLDALIEAAVWTELKKPAQPPVGPAVPVAAAPPAAG